MFADDLLQHGVADYHPGRVRPVLEQIKAAHKFILSPQFAAVADELRTDLDQIAKALPLCRLPFPCTWIEFAEAHRNRHEGHGEVLRWTQAPVKRVGFLLVADQPDDLARFRAYQFWQHTGEVSAVCAQLGVPPPAETVFKLAAHVARFDLTGESRFPLPPEGGPTSPSWARAKAESRRAISNVVQAELASYGPPSAWLLLLNEPDLLRSMNQEAIYDWNGEPAYLEAVLALLNCRNATAREWVDNSEHNRKRARRGRLPLSSHHVLTIHPRQLRRVHAARHDGYGDGVRRHFVMGHWKVRKTGIFFWLPHQRGSGRLGEVTKEYRVE